MRAVLEFIRKLPERLYKAMVCIFLLIIAAAMVVSTYKLKIVLCCAAAGTLVILRLSRSFRLGEAKWSDGKWLIVLSLVCFAVKFVWIYFMRIEPIDDYATFYYHAYNLSENWLVPYRYVAFFPHIMGYASFLSVFLSLTGHSYFLPMLLNVIMSVVSGVLIYRIVRAYLPTRAAATAYIFWIICPSQTMYNNLVLSEPLYTMLLLLFVYLFVLLTKREEKLGWWKMLLWGIALGAVLWSVNINRPIGAIIIIALFIWLLVLRADELKSKKHLLRWGCFMLSLLLAYSALGSVWNVYLESRLGEKPASVPGYNICVGFNIDSLGTWNVEDSEMLFHYSEDATPDEAQAQMLEVAKERIIEVAPELPRLFALKLRIFLSDDAACALYNSDIIPNFSAAWIICNLFYYFLLLLSLLGGWKMMKLSRRSAVFIMPLYFIGLTCAQMLVEVAYRYHYSLMPFLVMIPQFYLFKDTEEKESEI